MATLHIPRFSEIDAQICKVQFSTESTRSAVTLDQHKGKSSEADKDHLNFNIFVTSSSVAVLSVSMKNERRAMQHV